jgi:hypothetical protein
VLPMCAFHPFCMFGSDRFRPKTGVRPESPLSAHCAFGEGLGCHCGRCAGMKSLKDGGWETAVIGWKRLGRTGLVLIGLLFGSSHLAKASAQDLSRRPTLGFSIAEPERSLRRGGPLFARVVDALSAARDGGDAAFGRFLAPGAELELSVAPGVKQPFTSATIRAARASCVGPYSFDEGPDWAQLSWICRVDGNGPLAGILSFRDSPELSLTVWFDGQRIQRIEAMEPLWIPGRRRPAMNAYDALSANR